jgi:hypothetical protein
MFLFFLLMTAIERKDEDLIKIILKLIDISLLNHFGDDEESVANDFARSGLVESIKNLRKINPLLVTHHSKKGKTALTEAVYSNQLPVINYLTGAQLFKFASPLHHDAYHGRIKATDTLTIEKISSTDSAGYVPLLYAVAGGQIETIKILLAATPDEYVDINELVACVIVNNHSPEILKLLLAKKPLQRTSETAQKLLKALQKHGHPLVMLETLLALVSEEMRGSLPKTLIIEAVRGGFQLDIEKLIRTYLSKETRAQTEFLQNLTNILIAKNREETENSNVTETAKSVFNGFTDFLNSHPAELFKIAVVLIVSDDHDLKVDNTHLLRRLFGSVSVEVATAVVSNEEKKYPSKLSDMAERHKKHIMHAMLLPFDKTSDDKGARVFFQFAREFQEIIQATQQARILDANKIKSILKRLVNMHEVAVKSGTRANLISKIIAIELNQCLNELWKTAAYFCRDNIDKESLHKLLDLILFLIGQKKLPINAYNFSRTAQLAYALGRNAEAEKPYQMIAKVSHAVKENRNPRCFAHISLATTLLNVMNALEVKVTPNLLDLYLLNWPKLCNELFVADGALLQAEPAKLDVDSLQKAESALPAFLPSPADLETVSPALLENPTYTRYALLIKCNVIMFKDWLHTFERKIAKSIPHDVKLLEKFQLTSGLRPQAETLLAFFSFKVKLIKYLLDLMAIVNKCMWAEHLSYELPASFHEELKDTNKMISYLKTGIKSLPSKEKSKNKNDKPQDNIKDKDDRKEKSDSSSEEMTEEELQKDELIATAPDFTLTSSPMLFKPKPKVVPIQQPKRSRFIPTAEVSLVDFLVPKDKSSSSSAKPAPKLLAKPALSIRFKIKDENFKVAAPLRHFFEAIGPDKLVLGGSAVPYLADHKNKQPKDYDLVTAYTKEELYAKVKEVGGTITERGQGKIKNYEVVFEGLTFDITIARGSPNLPFRERLKEDAKARAVTICSLFYDPFTEKNERLIDFVNGLDDLKNDRVNLSDPSKLEELLMTTPKQMLRIPRLAGHDRTVDPEIVAAIKKHKELLHTMPSGAVEEELEKFFDEFNDDVEKIKTLLNEYELLNMQLINVSLRNVISRIKNQQRKAVIETRATALGMLRK